MRKFKLVSNGFPDVRHMKSALEIAKEHSGEMSIGDEMQFGTGNFKTVLKIQETDDILVVLFDEEK